MGNIVVISGSPRKNGNTDQLADAFIKGAEAAGNQVTKFHVADVKMNNGCLGCNYCQRNDGECVQKDGMQAIYDALYQADTLVLATPVYYFGMSGQIKMILDRTYASLSKPYPISSAALLVAYGGEQEADASSVVSQYHQILEYSNWQDKGVVTAGGLMEKNDIAGHPALLKAEELGKSFSK